MQSLDIIISSYGDRNAMPAHLKQCLASIRHFTSGNFRIILERSFESASENRNNGLSKSTADVICFLDDDVWVTPGWNEMPMQLLNDDRTVGLISPLILLENGQYFSCGLRYRHRDFIPIAYGSDTLDLCLRGFEPDALPTTALFAKREVIDGAGFFDNHFGQCQWEDIDYYLRMRLVGYKAMLCEQSKVYHAHFFRSSTFNQNYAYLLNKWSQHVVEPFYGKHAMKAQAGIKIEYVKEGLVIEGFEVNRKNKPGKPGIFSSTDNKLLIKLADSMDSRAVDLVNKQHYVYSQILDDAAYCIYPAGSIRLPGAMGNAVTGLIFPLIDNIQVELASDRLLSMMATYLAHFHQLLEKPAMRPHFQRIPVWFGGHSFWIGGFEILLDMCAWCRTRCASFPYDEILNTLSAIHALKEVFNYLFSAKDFVFIHGDLTKENVLAISNDTGEQLYLIDMEECSIGPSAYDLAKYAHSLQLSHAAEQFFIKEYVTAYNKNEMADQFTVAELVERFVYMKLLSMLDTGLGWYLQELYHSPQLLDHPAMPEKMHVACDDINNYLEETSNQNASVYEKLSA
jgi:GT2 family glycosyltransferase